MLAPELQVAQPASVTPKMQPGPITDFVRKLRLAWRIFFPEQPASMSAKDEGKNRLRMILVADRYVPKAGNAHS